MSRSGFLYGLLAYGWWGLVPLYFGQVRDRVPLGEILAQRIVWSILFLAGILTFLGRWQQVRRCLASRAVATLTLTAILVGLNWLLYIYSVAQERIKEASLGYYITPLVSVVLAIVFVGERLRPLQWLALGFALAGVAFLTQQQGDLPWLAMVLAVSFAFYGLLRKRLQLDAVVGLFIETLILLPAALGCLLCWGWHGDLVFGSQGAWLDVLIVAGGVVTAVPLLAFAEAANRLPLSTLGFLQYLSPSLQLTIAVLLFGESFGNVEQVSFLCIWTGLAFFSLDSYRQYRREMVLLASAGCEESGG